MSPFLVHSGFNNFIHLIPLFSFMFCLMADLKFAFSWFLFLLPQSYGISTMPFTQHREDWHEGHIDGIWNYGRVKRAGYSWDVFCLIFCVLFPIAVFIDHKETHLIVLSNIPFIFHDDSTGRNTMFLPKAKVSTRLDHWSSWLMQSDVPSRDVWFGLSFSWAWEVFSKIAITVSKAACRILDYHNHYSFLLI